MAFENDVGKLSILALGIVTVAIVVGVGSIVLAEMQPASWQTSDLQSENLQPSTPFPTNATVSQATADADFEELNTEDVEIIFEDTSAATNTTLTEGTDYNVYESDGIIEFLNTTATEDYSSADNDNMHTDYTYQFSGTPTSILETGITSLQSYADFFTVIVVVGIAAVLFLLLRVMRGTTRQVGA